jgi:hypothetical protein
MHIEPATPRPVFYWTPGSPDLTTRDEQAERVSSAIAAHPSIDPDNWIEQLSSSPVPVSRRPRWPLQD